MYRLGQKNGVKNGGFNLKPGANVPGRSCPFSGPAAPVAARHGVALDLCAGRSFRACQRRAPARGSCAEKKVCPILRLLPRGCGPEMPFRENLLQAGAGGPGVALIAASSAGAVALIGVVALPVLVVAVKGKAGRIVAPAPARK